MELTKPRMIFVGVEKKPGEGNRYIYKYANNEDSIIISSESPEKYNKRKTLEEIKSKFSEITIKYKGKEYNLDKLNKMYNELADFGEDKANDVPNIDVNQELDETKRKRLSDWKTKMAANSWKSRQRGLRKKGKLEQYKIDSLNKLGMVWDPKKDEWEKNYLYFRVYGFCDELEGWIKEQRSLFVSNKISNENLLRLKAIQFPFQSSNNEKFKFTKKSIWILKDKLFTKQRKLEREEEKRRGVFEEKKKKKKKQTKKELKDKERQKEANSFYKRKYHYCSDSFIYKFSEKEALDKLIQINKGESIYSGRLKYFLDSESEKFKSQGRKTPLWVRKFYSDINDDKLNSDQIYVQLSIFMSSKFSAAVRKKACIYMLKYISNRNLNNSNSFKEINFLISAYKKEKNTDELFRLKKYVEKYPILKELYQSKIDKIIHTLKP